MNSEAILNILRQGLSQNKISQKNIFQVTLQKKKLVIKSLKSQKVKSTTLMIMNPPKKRYQKKFKLKNIK